jgi:hypothetical protein
MISPYIKVTETSDSMQQSYDKVIAALKSNSFTVLGAYNPSGKSTLKVIAFTKSSLKNTVVKVKDRGALAAVYKIGLQKKNGKVHISYTNPDYVLRAYLRGNYSKYKTVFDTFSKDIKVALSGIGSDFTPFGGEVAASDLKDYHFTVMMPYFTDPVTLNTFSSFEEGVRVIQENLKAKKGKTKQVYKLIYKTKQVAVFGVGLQNTSKGEAKFLPIIGEDNLAALPYEIILQGTKATMLHGKYRLALYWPELSMGSFMKIRNTPGDIEDALEMVCKE